MPNSKVFLLTRPRHDALMRYFFAWSDPLVAMASSKGFNVCDLHDGKANKALLESYIAKNCPSLILFNGHGTTDTIHGDQDKVIVDADSKCRRSIVYARSCSCGERLGHDLVKGGARTFIGYRRDFYCGCSYEHLVDPKKDKLAARFLGPSNLIISTLLKGGTGEEAYQRSVGAMHKNFMEMISSRADYKERYAARYLLSNMAHQVLLGDALAMA